MFNLTLNYIYSKKKNLKKPWILQLKMKWNHVTMQIVCIKKSYFTDIIVCKLFVLDKNTCNHITVQIICIKNNHLLIFA